MSNHLTRRAFLAAATTSATVMAGCCTAGTKMNTAKVVPRKLSPNGKINLASIGCGGQGLGDTMNCHKFGDKVNFVGLCDVDWERCAEAFYKIPGAKQYKDYRKMLEEMDGQIDGLVISTPDHTHAPAAYMSMMMGKHVRVQKPLTHTIAEARLLAKTAKETGVVTAMGNQGHSGDGVRDLCEMLWSGAIGDVKEAHIWTDRPIWPQGIEKPLKEQAVPDTMDWDLWLGCAPKRPYNKMYAPFNWRGWWDFGCGAIGDMACHIMDPAFWALYLGNAPSYTVEVVQQERMTKQTPPKKSVIKYEFPERETPVGKMAAVTVYWYDGKLLPPRPAGIPEGETMGDGDNGSYFVGTKGVLSSGTYGGKSRLLPEAVMKDVKKPEQTIPRVPDENPFLSWIDACLTGGVAQSDFSYAGPLTEVANMGNVALLAGEKIEFDVASMKITNVKSANKYLSKEYRKPFDFMPL